MANSRTVYLVNGARTPVGAFLGTLSEVPAPTLGAAAIQAAIARSGLQPDAVEEVIMGCVLPAGIGQAPARQAMRQAGIPDSTGALTINKVCGSGLKAIMIGGNEILAGERDIIAAGGMESMSRTPYYLQQARTGFRMGHREIIDGLIHDGLWDPYHDFHMGDAAELCATKHEFSREAQDAYAGESLRRAQAAVRDGLFKPEIVPVSVPQRKGEPVIVDTDEQPGRGDLTKLSGLKPAFSKKDGTITAGNASSINDGAAALILASEEAVTRFNLKPMARILGSATHSQEPAWFTTAPVGAIEKVLVKLPLSLEDIDLFEINEAFAVVAMAAIQELRLPPEKVNVRGGAIALGHPIGASGARILVTLMYALEQLNLRTGLASLCIGGGEAVAMVIERL